MNLYTIQVSHVETVTYEVQANSAAQAIEAAVESHHLGYSGEQTREIGKTSSIETICEEVR